MNGDEWRVPVSFVSWIGSVLVGLIGFLGGLVFRALHHRIDILKDHLLKVDERMGHHDIVAAEFKVHLSTIQDTISRIERSVETIAEFQRQNAEERRRWQEKRDLEIEHDRQERLRDRA